MARHPHIILDEDNPALRTVLTVYLAHALPTAGINPTGNSVEALTLYHERGAALILSDCCMPEMSGLVLTLRLREEGAALPIGWIRTARPSEPPQRPAEPSQRAAKPASARVMSAIAGDVQHIIQRIDEELKRRKQASND